MAQEDEAREPINPNEATCNFCDESLAAVRCRADSARLCLLCDRHVHAANSVSSRHVRSVLCDTCRLAASTVFCSFPSCRLFLCSNCDFDLHGVGDASHGHGRRAVEGYTGCPMASELANFLGIGDGESGKGLGFVGLEMEKVFTLEDLIVPTTSCHGFHALETEPLSKNRSAPCRKHKDEILSQLNELTKLETVTNNFTEELDPVSQFKSWDSHYTQLNFNLGQDATHDSSNVIVPAFEDGKWNPSEFHDTNGKSTVDFPYDEYLVSPPETKLSSFVEMTEICPSAGHDTTTDRVKPFIETIHSLPPKSGQDLVCPDRDTVISRYKEKRKARRYDKLIRYESRKARADSRLRIRGRFAKADQVNKS